MTASRPVRCCASASGTWAYWLAFSKPTGHKMLTFQNRCSVCSKERGERAERRCAPGGLSHQVPGCDLITWRTVELSAVQSSQSLPGARLERAVLGLCLARKGSGKLPLWSSQPGTHSSCELVLFRILGTSFTGTQFG